MTEQPQRRTRLAFVIAPLVIFASVALMFAFALQKGDPSKLPSTFIGKPAPALNLPPVDGLTSAGKPVPGLAATDLKTGKPSPPSDRKLFVTMR